MFYVVEIVSTKDGTAKAITEKATQDEAVMLLHQVLASAMTNQNAQSCVCLVVAANSAICATSTGPAAEKEG